MERAVLTASIDEIIPDEFISLPGLNSHSSHRIYMAVSLSVSGNLLLLQCFHLTWKRKTWLPFYLFTLIVACGHDRKVRFSIAVFLPAIDSLLSGVSLVTILPLLCYSPDVAWYLFISNMKKGNLWLMKKYQMTLDDTLVLRGMSYWLLFCIIIFTGFQMSYLKISIYIILKEIRNL